ncbi:hypothetical protein CcaCcLH18_14270 [Colletotrichum camelliae]|nr:hypothetical protein CcaCcLH18_14270 [Colletotrichum camelliae]
MPHDGKVYISVPTGHLPRAGPHGSQSDATPSSSHNHHVQHAQDHMGISPLDLETDPPTMHDDGPTIRIHSALIRDLHNQVQSLQAQVVNLQAESKLQQSILSTFTGTDFSTTRDLGGAA